MNFIIFSKLYVLNLVTRIMSLKNLTSLKKKYFFLFLIGLLHTNNLDSKLNEMCSILT